MAAKALRQITGLRAQNVIAKKEARFFLEKANQKEIGMQHNVGIDAQYHIALNGGIMVMGKSIYFSDDELIRLELGLTADFDGCLPADEPTIMSAMLKVGLSLERPWALAENEALRSALEPEPDYGPPASAWWCIVDFIDSSIILRKGMARSYIGDDYVVDVKDDDLAQNLWEKFNNIQLSDCPKISPLALKELNNEM